MKIDQRLKTMLPPDNHPIENLQTVFHPHPFNEDTVEKLYTCRFSASFMNEYRFWRLPHLAPHLWFAQPADGGPGKLFVSGPTLHPTLVRHAPADLQITGVQLSPGSLGSFLAEPATLVVERSLPLSAFWGEEAARLEAELVQERDSRSQSERLFEIVSRRARHRVNGRTTKVVQDAISRIKEGYVSVGRLAEELGITSRHLHRLFAQEVGCSPKKAIRVVRLANVLETLTSGDKVAWSDVAAAQGFSDQSHMISDFRSLLGETPRRFVATQGPGLRYLNLGWLLSPISPPLSGSFMVPNEM